MLIVRSSTRIPVGSTSSAHVTNSEVPPDPQFSGVGPLSTGPTPFLFIKLSLHGGDHLSHPTRPITFFRCSGGAPCVLQRIFCALLSFRLRQWRLLLTQ